MKTTGKLFSPLFVLIMSLSLSMPHPELNAAQMKDYCNHLTHGTEIA